MLHYSKPPVSYNGFLYDYDEECAYDLHSGKLWVLNEEPTKMTSEAFRELHRDQIRRETQKLNTLPHCKEVQEYNSLINRVVNPQSNGSLLQLPERAGRYWAFLEIPKQDRHRYNLVLGGWDGRVYLIKRSLPEYNDYLEHSCAKY
jgi:hypothetical protein